MKQAYFTCASWLRTRKAQAESAQQLTTRREKLWQALQPAIARTPALQEFANTPLQNFPVFLPHQLREDIGQWNSCDIGHAQAHAAAEAAEKGEVALLGNCISAGYSTGTSGVRGLFMASPKERAIYLGQALAKLLPLQSLFGARVLLFLRADNALYSGGRLFSLTHCSLTATAEEKQRIAEQVNPTILIAPPHVLAELSRRQTRLPALRHCFYGAEPMGDAEALWITHVLGIRPLPIYQATEGFLAAPCHHGRLHLNEDSITIEWEAVKGTLGHQIIVTDLQRHTQPIVRVKLDDFIEHDSAPCPCGFGGSVIRPIAGRVQDIWRFAKQTVTPRMVTKLLEAELGASAEWKAIASPEGIQLLLNKTTSHDAAQQAAATLSRFAAVHMAELHEPPYPKRRRVEWRAS
ncbi:MAG: cell division protein FtsA [Alphaproteobacteria bacterium]|nr:cell division protein FtsA [Alphaproteobacteria bacterium]